MTTIAVIAVVSAVFACALAYTVSRIRKSNLEILGLKDAVKELESEKLILKNDMKSQGALYTHMPDEWRGSFYDTHRELVQQHATITTEYLAAAKELDHGLVGNQCTFVVHCKMFQIFGKEGKIKLLLEDPYGQIWTEPFSISPEAGPESHMNKYLIVDFIIGEGYKVKPERVRITKYKKEV